jgi:hypothetical protein
MIAATFFFMVPPLEKQMCFRVWYGRTTASHRQPAGIASADIPPDSGMISCLITCCKGLSCRKGLSVITKETAPVRDGHIIGKQQKNPQQVFPAVPERSRADHLLFCPPVMHRDHRHPPAGRSPDLWHSLSGNMS